MSNYSVFQYLLQSMLLSNKVINHNNVSHFGVCLAVLCVCCGSLMVTKMLCLCSRCLEFLLQSGATASLKDKQGYSPVHYAAAYGHRHCLELVSTHTHTHTNHMEEIALLLDGDSRHFYICWLIIFSLHTRQPHSRFLVSSTKMYKT